ncbi:C-terminal processing peptidase-3. Serine peptidase. MEROPS family S41A [bacterium A37T11]|nr:C-terminal processing peptidase-3. Serine peptidase. MEROPS family S41A [bacterium A37T11]
MRPSTKKNLKTAAIYSGILFLGLLLGQNFADENIRNGLNPVLPLGFTEKTTKLQQVLHLINDYYVDSLNIDTMQNVAINDLVSKLDPHSLYFAPERARRINEDLEGNFDGIGVEYYTINDTLLVTGIFPGGPAEKGGIHIGDKLLRVDDQLIAGVKINQKDVAAMVRGDQGTKVRIWIKRDGMEINNPFIIVRDKIKVSSIEAAYVIDTATAYVKIKRFGAQTAHDFNTAIGQLKKQGTNNLILDLRENGGGYLTAATELASQFLHDKQLIVYTLGAHHQRTDYFSSATGQFTSGKLAVLIDGESASASEIVAGAIQDLKRGIVVGQPSFGKGLIQEQFEFGDGSALNLTVARYFTPSGRCIQRPYDSFYGNKYFANGGGIKPDIYIAEDSLSHNDFYKKLLNQGIISDYVFENLVSEIPSFSSEHFIAHYKLPSNNYRRFLNFAQKRGIHVNNRTARLSKLLVESDMKALMGKYFFGTPSFYKIKNRTDPNLIRTIQVLRTE